MNGRFSRSIAVAKESYAILKSNPTLGFFPLISGISTLLVSIPFLVILCLSLLGQHHHQHFGTLHYVVAGALYFVNTLIVVFFNSALVACASENLQGRPATMEFGIRKAISRLPQIFCWSAIASTVGMVLRMISERTGVVGSIIAALFGLAWNLVVFFVVPVLVLENVSPIEAIKESGQMIRKTWGDRIILGIGFSSIFALLGVIAMVPLGFALFFLTSQLIPLGIFLLIAGVMYLVVLAIVGSALATIFQTALYLYSRNGMIPQGFASSSMQDAFQMKTQRRLFSR